MRRTLSYFLKENTMGLAKLNKLQPRPKSCLWASSPIMMRPEVSHESQEYKSKWQSLPCAPVEQLPQMESLLASYSKSNNFYLNLRSDWCVQLRFEFVYPYHTQHETAAAEPLTIPTTDWKSFNDDKLANYCLLNSFKNAKKSSKNLPSFSTTLQQVFRKLLEHFGMVLGHFPKSQS